MRKKKVLPIKKCDFRNTVRLFHNKYLFKIVVRCFFARDFRRYNIWYTKDIVNRWHINNGGKTPKPDETEYTLKLIEAIENTDYKNRCYRQTLTIYSNDQDLIVQLYNLDPTRVTQIHSPVDHLVERMAEKTIIVKGYPNFKYKVIFNKTDTNMRKFYAWCRLYKKNIHMTAVARTQLLKGANTNLCWIYVDTEVTLKKVQKKAGPIIREILTIIHI